MESGLSSRADRIVAELGPASLTLAPQPAQHLSTIDLSNAQNEVIRPELLDAYKSIVQNGMNTFALPAAEGDPRLRQNLAGFLNAYFQPVQSVLPGHIVLTAGASDAIEHVVHATCDDGDSIIVPGPYWPGFDPLAASRVNVNIVVAQPPTYTNYANYLVPSLQAAYDFSPVKRRIKAVLLSNPSNPLGRCYSRDILIDCLEFCQERGLHLICDEVYALTDLGHVKKSEEFVSVLSLTNPFMPEGAIKVYPNLVHVIWSASKLFGISGLRVGCFISQHNPELIRAMALLTATHTNTVSTLYLSTLLSSSQLPRLLSLNSERLTRSYLVLEECLHRWNVEFVQPTHGLFVFARLAKNVRTEEQEKHPFDELLRVGLRVSSGRSFRGKEGEFGWARIRFAVAEMVMREAVTKLDYYFERQRHSYRLM